MDDKGHPRSLKKCSLLILVLEVRTCNYDSLICFIHHGNVARFQFLVFTISLSRSAITLCRLYSGEPILSKNIFHLDEASDQQRKNTARNFKYFQFEKFHITIGIVRHDYFRQMLFIGIFCLYVLKTLTYDYA